VQETAPWELAKTRREGSAEAGERLATVLYNLVDVLRLLGNCVWAVMPEKAASLLAQLGLDASVDAGWQSLTSVGTYPAGARVSPGEVLFPRFDESALD
jgi:methionyl-tRNA synthetase